MQGSCSYGDKCKKDHKIPQTEQEAIEMANSFMVSKSPGIKNKKFEKPLLNDSWKLPPNKLEQTKPV